jgi:hypothetical protein
MTPRRLLPYLVIFLVLASTYAGLRWHQERRIARDEQAKKVFHLKENDISDLGLARGKDEIRLAKQNQEWRLTAPLSLRADQTTVDSMLTTLARLRKERELGGEKELKPFGLDKPGLVVQFTAQGQPHRLAVGAKAPGGRSYYALKDQDPHLFMITVGNKDSLDRQLLALRDKTLLAFITSEAKGLKIKTAATALDLEKTGPQGWRWVGRPDFRVRSDRVETLLRDIHLARAKDFPAAAPDNPAALGLAPGRWTEITVVTPSGDQTLFLGAKKGDAVYARKGAAGPVVLVDAGLPGEIGQAMNNLQDRRLWSGAIPDVHRIVWGPPGQTWTAGKDGETWKLTGPDQAATKQPAVRLELALWNFQKLEAEKFVPQSGPVKSPPVFTLELADRAGKPLVKLTESAPSGKGLVTVLLQVGEKTMLAQVSAGKFRQWQEEMHRLTVLADKPGKTPAPGASGPRTGKE